MKLKESVKKTDQPVVEESQQVAEENFNVESLYKNSVAKELGLEIKKDPDTMISETAPFTNTQKEKQPAVDFEIALEENSLTLENLKSNVTPQEEVLNSAPTQVVPEEGTAPTQEAFGEAVSLKVITPEEVAIDPVAFVEASESAQNSISEEVLKSEQELEDEYFLKRLEELEAMMKSSSSTVVDNSQNSDNANTEATSFINMADFSIPEDTINNNNEAPVSFDIENSPSFAAESKSNEIEEEVLVTSPNKDKAEEEEDVSTWTELRPLKIMSKDERKNEFKNKDEKKKSKEQSKHLDELMSNLFSEEEEKKD